METWIQFRAIPPDGDAPAAVGADVGDAEVLCRLSNHAAADPRIGFLLAAAPATAVAFHPLSPLAAEALASRDPERLRRLGAPDPLIALVTLPRVGGVLFPN